MDAIHTVADVMTTATYYNDGACGGQRRGEVNQGWRLITTQLNHERVGSSALGGLAHRMWDRCGTGRP